MFYRITKNANFVTQDERYLGYFYDGSKVAINPCTGIAKCKIRFENKEDAQVVLKKFGYKEIPRVALHPWENRYNCQERTSEFALSGRVYPNANEAVLLYDFIRIWEGTFDSVDEAKAALDKEAAKWADVQNPFVHKILVSRIGLTWTIKDTEHTAAAFCLVSNSVIFHPPTKVGREPYRIYYGTNLKLDSIFLIVESELKKLGYTPT